MIKLEQGMCVSDIEQWVGGGVFLTEIGSKLIPAQVSWWPERDDGEHDDRQCESCDEEMFSIHTLEDVPVERRFCVGDAPLYIYPHWPLCGSVNLLRYKLAVHVERLQMKQWRRTFNWRQVKVLVPQQWFIHGPGQLCYENSDTVRSIFDPEYPSCPMELDAWFADGWKSVALTPHVIVVNTTPRMVYYNGQLACKLRRDGSFDPVDVRITHVLSKLYPGGIRV